MKHHSKITQVSEELLRKLYLDEERSLKEIGEIIGCSSSWVRILMNKYKIPRRHSFHKIVSIARSKEWKARLGEKQKELWSNEEYRRKMSRKLRDALSRPEVKLRRIQGMKECWAKRKANGVKIKVWDEGKHLPKKMRKKISIARKKVLSDPIRGPEIKRKISLANKGRKFSAEVRKKMSEAQRRKVHNKFLFKELENLRKQGFRCIVTSIKPIPDAIAIKDGKVFAVEIETENTRPPNYGKYNGISFYDDIFWIFKKRR